MGWSIGYDSYWKRDIGYGVPAICDHPDCNEEIDRGLAYVCGAEPYGGDDGCGLFFCGKHLMGFKQVCECCDNAKKRKNGIKFTPKPDTKEWINWKLSDDSWHVWRMENPREVALMKSLVEA
jgi:hypothetical protein